MTAEKTEEGVVEVRTPAAPAEGVPVEWCCPVCGDYSLSCSCEYDLEQYEGMGFVPVQRTPTGRTIIYF